MKFTTAGPVPALKFKYSSSQRPSEVPYRGAAVKSSRPKSEVPAAASGPSTLFHFFSFGFSPFPCPLLTLHSRHFNLVRDTTQFLHPHLRANHPIGFNSIFAGISYLLLLQCSCLFSFLSCCLLGIVSLALLLPVTCRRPLYLPSPFPHLPSQRQKSRSY